MAIIFAEDPDDTKLRDPVPGRFQSPLCIIGLLNTWVSLYFSPRIASWNDLCPIYDGQTPAQTNVTIVDDPTP